MILSFSISNVSVSTSVDVDISISDSILQPIVTQSIEDRDIPLFYFGVEAKDIYDYVNIDQPKFGKNKIKRLDNIGPGSSIAVSTSNLDITDVYNSYFDETIPLWYKHSHTTNSVIGSPTIISMVLYDYNMEEVDPRLWKYDSVSKILYTNIKNHRDPNSNRHIVYYVSTMYSDQQNSVEILNATNVYLLSDSVNIVKKYNLNYSASSISLNIGTSATVLYVRENMENVFDTKIYGDINSSNWNIAVKNDAILFDGEVYSIQGSFNSMSFSNTGTAPIMKITSKRVEVFNPTLLWVDLPGHLVVDGLPRVSAGLIPVKYEKLQLIVRDSQGKLKHVFTNYDSQNWVFEDTTGSVEAEFSISSVSENGYIKIYNEISIDDIVEISGYMYVDYCIGLENIKITNNAPASWQYYAEYFGFNGSNTKLLANPSLIIFNEKPDSISNPAANTFTYTIKHPFVDDDNFVIYDIQNGTPPDPMTWTIIAGVLTPSDLTKGVIAGSSYNTTTGLITLVYTGTYVDPSVDNLTTTYNRESISNAIEISNVTVTKKRTFNNIDLLDIRQRGGGINPKYKDIVDLIYPESIYYKNINNFSTLDLFISAGLIVNLPGNILLKRFNGVFEEQQLQKITSDSMRAGIPGIVRYYNIAPQIESIEYGEDIAPYMVIEWKDIQNFSYKLHISYDGSEFNLIKPTPTTALPATAEDLFTGTYSYKFYYNPPTPNNNLIYVKIEGLYTDNAGNEITGNFSETYRIVRV